MATTTWGVELPSIQVPSRLIPTESIEYDRLIPTEILQHSIISNERLFQLNSELSSYYYTRSDTPFFNLDSVIDTSLPPIETFLTFKLRIMNEVLEAKSKEELLSISRRIS